MTTRSEDTLFASLNDVEALEILIGVGMDLACIPTEPMRRVVEWAIERYFESGRKSAPSRALMLEYWLSTVEDAGVELLDESEETDNIEAAIESLKSQYAHYQFERWLRTASIAMTGAAVADRIELLSEVTNDLFSLSLSMQSKISQMDALEGIAAQVAAYEERATQTHAMRGMSLGIPPIDAHLYGIHPGEICVVAGAPKTGKSLFATFVALAEWKRGRRVVLFTLENSMELTFDRMACQALAIDARNWSRGTADPADVMKVKEWLANTAPTFAGICQVIMPPPGHRTMSAMVRQAQMLGADSLIIDQLTFVDHPSPRGKGRPEVIRDLMHELKVLVSTSKYPISTLLMHQINREGIKVAKKANHLEMEHMAEGSEVERTADMVLGLWQSLVDRNTEEAIIQLLAARREDLKWWKVKWGVAKGHISVDSEMEMV